jgi:hypothetical protein
LKPSYIFAKWLNNIYKKFPSLYLVDGLWWAIRLPSTTHFCVSSPTERPVFLSSLVM